MIIINLRIYYPMLYHKDAFCELPEQIKLLLDELKRFEHAQDERRRYHGEFLTFIEGVTDWETDLPSLEEAYLKTRKKEELYRAILKLPCKQMRRIYAHFFLEMRLTHIARIENVSVAAVSTSIAQGIRNLRRHMNRD